MLFYDLSIFAIVAMIAYGDAAIRRNRPLMRDLAVAWIVVDVYLIVFMFVGPHFVQPLLLVLISVLIYRRVMLVAQKA